MNNYEKPVKCPVCLGSGKYGHKDCFFCDADCIMWLDDDQYGHIDHCEKCGHETVSDRGQLKFSYYRSTRTGQVFYFDHDTDIAIDYYKNKIKIEREDG